jgi:hypothetical protein
MFSLTVSMKYEETVFLILSFVVHTVLEVG